MNMSHNGVRLGQALYKICNRLKIVHKVRCIDLNKYLSEFYDMQIGHITCDNASNNGTMLDEFGRCYRLKTGGTFDTQKRHIR
jgi:hypothetical protein